MDTNKNQAQELVTLLESIMDFRKWGFKQSYMHISHEIFPEVIYESELCKVKFVFEHSGEKYPYPDIRLDVLYVRLHAPDNGFFMTFKGENCWCWHNVNDALRFLDGMTPKEAADEWNAYRRRVSFVKDTIKIMVDKKILHPEREIRTQSAIWEHYGKKLFEIYNMQKPKIWKEYAEFIREFHNLIELESHSDFPTKDKIC